MCADSGPSMAAAARGGLEQAGLVRGRGAPRSRNRLCCVFVARRVCMCGAHVALVARRDCMRGPEVRDSSVPDVRMHAHVCGSVHVCVCARSSTHSANKLLRLHALRVGRDLGLQRGYI